MVIAGKNFYILLFGCTRQDNLYEVQQMERNEGKVTCRDEKMR